MATATAVEFEPLQTSDCTEVKVPITPGGGRISNSMVTTAPLSPGTEPKPISKSSDEQDGQYLKEFNKLRKMYLDFPTDMFVANVIREYASSEPDLEYTRSLLFESLKDIDEFTYGYQAELKKRLCTRKGEPVVVKLVHDVHTLLSIIEGEDFSNIKDLISTSRGRTLSCSLPLRDVSQRSVPTTEGLPNNNNTEHKVKGNCQCNTELNLLKDTVSGLQADLLLFKQTIHAADKLIRQYR